MQGPDERPILSGGRAMSSSSRCRGVENEEGEGKRSAVSGERNNFAVSRDGEAVWEGRSEVRLVQGKSFLISQCSPCLRLAASSLHCTVAESWPTSTAVERHGLAVEDFQ